MADLLNYRKEDSDMNYNINEQKLGFDRVLPWEGQVPALVKEGEQATSESTIWLKPEEFSAFPFAKPQQKIWTTFTENEK